MIFSKGHSPLKVYNSDKKKIANFLVYDDSDS